MNNHGFTEPQIRSSVEDNCFTDGRCRTIGTQFGMGHYCRICGRSRPNEKFSGRGHRTHICKDCQRMPREDRERIERRDELHGFLHHSNISEKNLKRLGALRSHPEPKVASLAALIEDIARVLPGKRSRWWKLAQRHRPMFNRSVEPNV